MSTPYTRAAAVGLLGWASLATVAALGCFPSPKPKAASTLKCPESQLIVHSNTTTSDIVTGCGKSDVIVMEPGGKTSSLRERVAFELSCPNEQIEVTILGTSLYGVTGCGKKMVYQSVPGVGIVANTSQKDTGGGPSSTDVP